MITNYHASVVDNFLYYSFAETGSFRVSSCNFDWYTQWANVDISLPQFESPNEVLQLVLKCARWTPFPLKLFFY